jgi:glucose/arabinose dehydrogenase
MEERKMPKNQNNKQNNNQTQETKKPALVAMISLPNGIKISVNAENQIRVTAPKGAKLTADVASTTSVAIFKDGKICYSN